MMGLRFSKVYLGLIWILLSFGTVLYLVDESHRLEELRAALELNLQEAVDTAQASLDQYTVTWNLRITQAEVEVANANTAVSEFLDPENADSYGKKGWYFKRAKEDLEVAQRQLDAISDASRDELTALQEILRKATAQKPADLARFDEEEALKMTDWLYAFLGLFIGLGLVAVPVRRGHAGEEEISPSAPEPPPVVVRPPTPRAPSPPPVSNTPKRQEDPFELELDDPAED